MTRANAFVLYLEFRKFMISKGASLDPTIDRFTHICNERCGLFKLNSEYVCTLSGRIHYCTPESCTFKIQQGGSAVCILTGNVFAETEYVSVFPTTACDTGDAPADDEVGVPVVTEEGEKEQELLDMPITEPRTERKKEEGKEDREKKKKICKDAHPYQRLERLLQSLESKSKKRQKKSEREEDAKLHAEALQIVKRLCVSEERSALDSGVSRTEHKRFESCFRRYISSQARSQAPISFVTLYCLLLKVSTHRRKRRRSADDEMDSIHVGSGSSSYSSGSDTESKSMEMDKQLRFYADRCVQWWKLLKDVAPKGKKPVKYRFEYHCVAMLYIFANGCRNREKVYIEIDPQLEMLLPSTQHHHLLGLDPRNYTNHFEWAKYRIIKYHDSL